MSRLAYVYMLASKKNGTLYTGVTSSLEKRLYEHKTKAHTSSFTAKYDVNMLVWYVAGDDISAAIELEKKIKNRNRAWKISLIEKSNPDWMDLSLDFSLPCTPALSPCAKSQGQSWLVMDAATDAQHDGRVKPLSFCTKLQNPLVDEGEAV
jgi:putative endonuclease